MHLASLSDQELLSELASVCLEGRRLVARQIAYLVEVEDRGLDKKSACASMWEFCTKRLGMSHGETRRRLNAARLVRRFPSILGRVERGEIHLSALEGIGRYLDDANVDALLDEVKGKTKDEVKELLACRFPRPDAPTREIPLARIESSMMGEATARGPVASVGSTGRSRIEPLSATGFLVQMTLTAEGYADLRRAKELLGHCVPDGDTVKVVERALRALVEKLEKARRAKTSRRVIKQRPSAAGHIPAATRREVFARDGEQCTFEDGNGRRCECRIRLELDHITPRALGGTEETSNLRVRCRAHNRLAAEEIFGRENVARRIHCRQRQQRIRQHAAVDEALGQATRGLVNMGFATSEVKKTLEMLVKRHQNEGTPPPLPELLREAIRALTAADAA